MCLVTCWTRFLLVLAITQQLSFSKNSLSSLGKCTHTYIHTLLCTTKTFYQHFTFKYRKNCTRIELHLATFKHTYFFRTCMQPTYINTPEKTPSLHIETLLESRGTCDHGWEDGGSGGGRLVVRVSGEDWGSAGAPWPGPCFPVPETLICDIINERARGLGSWDPGGVMINRLPVWHTHTRTHGLGVTQGLNRNRKRIVEHVSFAMDASGDGWRTPRGKWLLMEHSLD